MANSSPASMEHSLIFPAGSSRTQRVRRLMPRIRHGPTSPQAPNTLLFLSRLMISIGNRIPKVCTPDDGVIRSPVSGSSLLRLRRPTRRSKAVSAINPPEQTRVSFVTFRISTLMFCMLRLQRIKFTAWDLAGRLYRPSCEGDSRIMQPFCGGLSTRKELQRTIVPQRLGQ